MQGVHEDCEFVVGIVVNGGGRQGITGDGRRLRVTTGDGRQPQSYEEMLWIEGNGRGPQRTAEYCLVTGINDGMQLVWGIPVEDNHTRSPVSNKVFIDQMEV